MPRPIPAAVRNASLTDLRTNFSNLDGSVLLDMGEVAAILGISVHTVKSWKYNPGKEKGPEAIKFGRNVRYPVASVRQWLAECRKAGQELLGYALSYMKDGAGKILGPVRPDGRSAIFAVTTDGVQGTVDIRYLCFPGGFDPRPRTATAP